jgi:xanthine dehydrogenase accessory factor
MKVWQFIKNKYEASLPVMLLYVLESSGSSPGRRGFCMAVAADGKMCGSIGGGIMEHKFAEMVKARLAEGSGNNSIHKQIHDKAAGKNQSGMICSGEQTIFLHKVEEKDIQAVNALLESLAANKNGSLLLSQEGMFFNNEIPSTDFSFHQYSETEFELTEKTGIKTGYTLLEAGIVH